MDKLDRFQSLHRLFISHRKPVPLSVLAERMECSEKTVKRTMEEMRDFYGAPIEYFPAAKGWHYAQDPSRPDSAFQLPGLWLTSEELQSLTLLLHVLEGFGNGLLNEELHVVEKEIESLLAKRGISPSAFAEQIRVLPHATRSVPGKIFSEVGQAILQRKQVRLEYRDFNGKKSLRTLSPQTLVHYRDNWYLDAWCHNRNDMRTFSLARMLSLQVLEAKARVIPKAELTPHFNSSYGIFSGKGQHTARLRFLPAIAREISLQQWHPQQQGKWEGEDYVLAFPYSDPRELIGDIQRHLPHVIIEAPASLKKTVESNLRAALHKTPAA